MFLIEKLTNDSVLCAKHFKVGEDAKIYTKTSDNETLLGGLSAPLCSISSSNVLLTYPLPKYLNEKTNTQTLY